MATRLRQISADLAGQPGNASAVALAPQCDSLDPEIIEAPLPPGAFDFNVRDLDTTPARETLMFSIMPNATAPAGCESDLARFKH